MARVEMEIGTRRSVTIPSDDIQLEGELFLPARPNGIVLFVHGSGSSRHSPRNKFVARALNEAGIGTLLFDLLTEEEENEEGFTGRPRFDINLLVSRLRDATRWIRTEEETRTLPIGYFGSSTGAAAALVAAAEPGDQVAAVVSRGGRPDLAGPAVARVKAPTLLIVGGRDEGVIELNRKAYLMLYGHKRIEIIDRATHLFEEPGALEEVARLAGRWFREHFEMNRQASDTWTPRRYANSKAARH